MFLLVTPMWGKAALFLVLDTSFPLAFPIIWVAGMIADLPSPHRPVRLLGLSQPNFFSSLVGTHLSILLSVVLSSFFIGHPFSFLEPVVTLVVPWMCSFLTLSLRVTTHIHRSISILSTQSVFLVSLFLLLNTRDVKDVSCNVQHR